jgi:hypothetical protein
MGNAILCNSDHKPIDRNRRDCAVAYSGNERIQDLSGHCACASRHRFYLDLILLGDDSVTEREKE